MADENIPLETTNEGDMPEGEAVEAAPQEPEIELPTLPLFGKWDAHGITVSDVGLAKYINLHSLGIPHHGGRWGAMRFGKSKMPLVERLINNMMRTENFTGKKQSATKVVRDAFDVINERTKENPIQVLVNAIINAAPKEETTRLKYGGISVPKAVDTAPQRRLDLSIRNLAMGAVQTSHKNKKPASQCLAEEIIKASKGDPASFAVAKRDDVERVAKSAR
jgi:small subunit ribosomal protein S7